MKRRTASCPSCAGPVEFRLSTALVTVCDYCKCVIARSDKKLEDHGKVADLVDTGSPFERGMNGRFEGKSFEIVGQVQYQHPAGGVWNEWYLRFGGDRVRWLAEAQGKRYLMAPLKIDSENIPPFDSYNPGEQIQLLNDLALVVAERGVAKGISAAGDIPWKFEPNIDHHFVDLQGTKRQFATIEFDGDSPQIFLGREVELAELNLSGSGWAGAAPATPGKALKVSCPHCGGPLALVAPDQTERVCCPQCHSMLDCKKGQLEYLQTLRVPRVEPQIPLGAVGQLKDQQFTVIGFMVRYVLWKSTKYAWTEYLMYSEAIGFRWLVNNRGHWSLVESVSVSDARESVSNTATFQGDTFRLFGRDNVHVDYIAGEFYWKVTIDELVEAADYIAPPRMLSFERTRGASADELNVSLGTYVEREEIEVGFQLKKPLPAPFGVGTIQPQPKRTDIWLIWIASGVLLILMNLLFRSLNRTYDDFYFLASAGGISLLPVVLLITRYSFEVSRWKDSDFNPYAGSDDGDDE